MEAEVCSVLWEFAFDRAVALLVGTWEVHLITSLGAVVVWGLFAQGTLYVFRYNGPSVCLPTGSIAELSTGVGSYLDWRSALLAVSTTTT